MVDLYLSVAAVPGLPYCCCAGKRLSIPTHHLQLYAACEFPAGQCAGAGILTLGWPAALAWLALLILNALDYTSLLLLCPAC